MTVFWSCILITPGNHLWAYFDLQVVVCKVRYRADSTAENPRPLPISLPHRAQLPAAECLFWLSCPCPCSVLCATHTSDWYVLKISGNNQDSVLRKSVGRLLTGGVGNTGKYTLWPSVRTGHSEWKPALPCSVMNTSCMNNYSRLGANLEDCLTCRTTILMVVPG